MPNSIIPTQIGGLPIGSEEGSQVVIGRDSTVTFEAIGLGEKGRPDYVEKIIMHLSTKGEDNIYTKVISIILDVAEINTLIEANENIPEELKITLKEASVCEVNEETGISEEKKMIILASQTYPPITEE